jgi:hypothetical protein
MDEDDEAMMIAGNNHTNQFAKTTVDGPTKHKADNALGDLGLLHKRQTMNKKKHWLLDSDRFDIILQTNNNNNAALTKKDSGSSQRYNKE